MTHAAIYGSAIVVCHAIVSLVHGLAHSELQIGLSPTETGFVLVVIGLCSLVAMGLLWTSWKTSGLFCSSCRWPVLCCCGSNRLWPRSRASG